MGFAFDKFFSWFPFLPAHPLPRFLNPGNFGLHEVKDRFIGASKGSRDADMSRRSDTKVHVPDIFRSTSISMPARVKSDDFSGCMQRVPMHCTLFLSCSPKEDATGTVLAIRRA